MKPSLTIEIVPEAECEGHHINLFLARGARPKALHYCDGCAVRLRNEIRRAMREWNSADEDEGVPA
jgi:hypothetical protein